MLLKECGRCKKLIPYGSTYCSVCTPIVEAETLERKRKYNLEAQKRYNKKRDPKYLQFYNSKEWRILSRKYAQDKGFRCEACGAIANEVHHKEFIQTPGGWERRLDYDNLELLCTVCHNERHERFKAKRERKKIARSIHNVDI